MNNQYTIKINSNILIEKGPPIATWRKGIEAAKSEIASFLDPLFLSDPTKAAKQAKAAETVKQQAAKGELVLPAQRIGENPAVTSQFRTKEEKDLIQRFASGQDLSAEEKKQIKRLSGEKVEETPKGPEIPVMRAATEQESALAYAQEMERIRSQGEKTGKIPGYIVGAPGQETVPYGDRDVLDRLTGQGLAGDFKSEVTSKAMKSIAQAKEAGIPDEALGFSPFSTTGMTSRLRSAAMDTVMSAMALGAARGAGTPYTFNPKTGTLNLPTTSSWASRAPALPKPPVQGPVSANPQLIAQEWGAKSKKPSGEVVTGRVGDVKGFTEPATLTQTLPARDSKGNLVTSEPQMTPTIQPQIEVPSGVQLPAVSRLSTKEVGVGAWPQMTPGGIFLPKGTQTTPTPVKPKTVEDIVLRPHTPKSEPMTAAKIAAVALGSPAATISVNAPVAPPPAPIVARDTLTPSGSVNFATPGGAALSYATSGAKTVVAPVVTPVTKATSSLTGAIRDVVTGSYLNVAPTARVSTPQAKPSGAQQQQMTATSPVATSAKQSVPVQTAPAKQTAPTGQQTQQTQTAATRQQIQQQNQQNQQQNQTQTTQTQPTPRKTSTRTPGKTPPRKVPPIIPDIEGGEMVAARPGNLAQYTPYTSDPFNIKIKSNIMQGFNPGEQMANYSDLVRNDLTNSYYGTLLFGARGVPSNASLFGR